MTRYLISDLHLSADTPDSAALFFRFMDELAPHSDALYVLGDLFEAWVGDDDDDAFVARVREAFARYSTQGKALYFQRGNRDFLLGEQFAADCGGQLLAEQVVVELAGESCLLMHGDELCTDDVAYQQFRQMVRSPQWQNQFLAQPLAVRKAIAADLRRKSRDAQQDKAEYIMDANADAIADVMQRHKVRTLIHGHTHRPMQHVLSLAGEPAKRIVLGDWHAQAKILRVTDQLELITTR